MHTLFPTNFSFKALDTDIQTATSTTIRILQGLGERRRTRPSDFKTLSQVRADFIPVPHFAFQYALGAIGIPKRSLDTLLGVEAVGKTTLMFEIMGWGMWQGCPAAYIGTESKPMPVDRAKRALSTSRKVAEAMADRILWTKAYSLQEFERKLIDIADAYRGRLNSKENNVCIPIDTPIIIGVDVFSSLMSNEEAEGFYGYGKTAEKLKNEDFAEANSGSNLVHAKWAHAFARRLPAFLDTNNIVLLASNHQTEKINMTAGARPMGEEVGGLFNKTHRGGRAFNQKASVQLNMVAAGQHKVGETVVGKKVIIRTAKQSFGPEGRRLIAILNTEMREDSGDYLQPAMDFDQALCDILMEHKVLDLQVESKRYTSKTLGIFSVTPRDVALAFHSRPDLILRAGQQLRIEGYADAVDRAQQEALANAAEDPPAQQASAMRLDGSSAPEPAPEDDGDE